MQQNIQLIEVIGIKFLNNYFKLFDAIYAYLLLKYNDIYKINRF
jgi:hypothetical protein